MAVEKLEEKRNKKEEGKQKWRRTIAGEKLCREIKSMSKRTESGKNRSF